MCGLVAVVSREQPIGLAELDAALDAISHRGPDGRGVWTSQDRRVALGHVRLALRDIGGGAQPIASERHEVIAVVNGELYGAGPLRQELRALGHVFRTASDSEIVVHAWQTWGPQMLPRLRGEFAFALYDTESNTVFCARDRFGIKPLAWTQHAGRVLIASQARALFALGAPRAWDSEALLRAASFQYAGPRSTLFQGIHELPAGHSLTIEAGRATVSRYWDLDLPCSRGAVDVRAAVVELRTRFDDAVRERLIADVPVAVQLSGGLDSAAVLASATQALGAAPDAFTVSFTDAAGYDERAHAQSTAAHFGARLHVVAVTDRDVASALPGAIAASEGACINAHAAAKLLLSAAVRDAGFKIVLTGEGADELLMGYPHFRSDLSGSDAGLARTNEASMGLMLPDTDGLSTAAVAAALGHVPTWMRAKAAFGGRVRGMLRDGIAEVQRQRDPARDWLDLFDIEGQMAGREPVDQSSYSWTKLALEGYILRTLGDGLEMASGIEGRVPMLDHLLFETIRSLPTSMKINGGVEKWALREAMRDVLPEGVRSREKHPFLAPPVGPETMSMLQDAFASASFDRQPLLDPAKVRAYAARAAGACPTARKLLDPALVFALSISVLHTSMGLS